MNPQDILPRDLEGLLHGYCEWYYGNNGQLAWKGARFHGKDYGYFEDYKKGGSVDEALTGYYLDDLRVSDTNDIGYCLIWNRMVII